MNPNSSEKKEHLSLREEWRKFYLDLGMEPINIGTINQMTIADWWEEKIAALLHSKAEEIRAHIPGGEINSDFEGGYAEGLNTAANIVEGELKP
jgi:hypothetical protein